MDDMVRRITPLDTGIGREAGYKDDNELIEAAERERQSLSAWQRQMLDTAARREVQAFLFGEDQHD
jgi:hypothetical protein